MLVAFLVASAASPASGQGLSGRVTDAETAAALEGATVHVPAAESGTATGPDGRYALAGLAPGRYRVVFSFIGFRTETRIVDVDADGETLDVALTPSAVEAAPITITAKAQASDILSTPQAVVVLDERQLVEQRGGSALDALEAVPGVRMLRTGVGLAKPVIRGLSSQRVLVIRDGVRQEGQQWGEEHAPELNAFGIERLEVVKGPASLLYGSDALGGVIQASDADLFDYDRTLAGTVALQGMSNQRLGAGHAELGGREGRWVYDAGFTMKRSGAFDTPEGLIPNTGLEERNVSARAGYALSRGTVQAAYQRFDAEIGMVEPDELEEVHAHGIDRFAIGEPFQHVVHDRAKLQARLPLAGHRLEWTGSWQQNQRQEFGHHHGADEEHGEAPHEEEGHEDALHEEEPSLFLKLRTYATDVRLHHRPIGRLFGTVGLSGLLRRNQTLAEETLIPGARTLNGAVYVFEEWAGDRLTVSGGLRHDRRRLEVDANADLGVEAQTRSYAAWSGALGAAWQPTSALSLAANVGRAWRAPVLIELFGNGVHEGTVRFERGTPTLEPEQSLSFDGTLRWLNQHLYVEVNGFLNQIDRFIYPRRTGAVDPASGYLVYQYSQARARLWGGEFRADFHPHPLDWMHLRVSGDVTRTLNVETGDPLPFSPPPRLRAEVEVEREDVGPFDRLSLRLGPTVTARQERVAPLEAPTDGYTTWDAGVSGQLRLRGATVTPVVAVENLFDTAYASHLSRLRPFEVLEPGRNVKVQLVVRWD